MKKHCALLSLLTIVASQSMAAQYAVQLEASKYPKLDRYQSLRMYGTLFTMATDNGLVRTRLGPYDNKDLALDVLDNVHAAGYTNAFIAKQNSHELTPLPTSRHVSSKRHDIESFDVTTLHEWKTLTPKQQSNVVYLDGILHVKNGDSFIRLDEINTTNK